jgi:hypothetical protein
MSRYCSCCCVRERYAEHDNEGVHTRCISVISFLLFAFALLGGVFGGISLAYRETNYTSIDSSSATIIEPTTGQTFTVSTSIITTKIPESRTADDPGRGWTNTIHLVLFDPSLVTMCCLAVLGSLTAFACIIYWHTHYKYMHPYNSCKCRNPKQDFARCYFWIWFLIWGALAVAGGGYIGARYNKLESGYCHTQYYQSIPNSPDYGPSLHSHCGVPFYGASNGWQDTFVTYPAYEQRAPYQTNIWPVDWSSPHPDGDSSLCWLDQISEEGGVTFNDPKWVQNIFWASMGGLLLLCVLFQYWCCKEPCGARMESWFGRCDDDYNALCAFCSSCCDVRCSCAAPKVRCLCFECRVVSSEPGVPAVAVSALDAIAPAPPGGAGLQDFNSVVSVQSPVVPVPAVSVAP